MTWPRPPPGTGRTEIEGGTGSFVEFENRHGMVWYGAWHLAEWTTQSGTPHEIGIGGADRVRCGAAARLGAMCLARLS
jgi:hypothetical protein